MIATRRYRPGARVRVGDVEVRYVRCLKRDFFAVNHLVEWPSGEKVVLKWARFHAGLARRETAIYRRLQGIEGIPRLFPQPGEGCVAHEFVEGVTLLELFKDLGHRRRRHPTGEADPGVGREFYDRLEALTRAIHARSVAVVDLNKPDNVIVRPDGNPAIIDFQISLAFPRRRGPLGERVFRFLAESDLYHVRKHRRRHGLYQDEEERRAGTYAARPAIHVFHRRFLRDPWLAFRKRFLPADW